MKMNIYVFNSTTYGVYSTKLGRYPIFSDVRTLAAGPEYDMACQHPSIYPCRQPFTVLSLCPKCPSLKIRLLTQQCTAAELVN